jgi:hypothetical protein
MNVSANQARSTKGMGKLNTADSKARLLQRLEQRWGALVESYAGLSAVEMMKPGVIGAWSVKDVIAHVTSWEEEALTHLPTVLQGGRPPRYSVTHGGIDAFNASTVERRRLLSLAEVLRQRDDTHRRLVQFVGKVPAAEFAREARFRRRLRLDTYGHYLRHAEAIRRWRHHVRER